MVSEFIVVVADLLHSVQPEGMQAPRNRWLLSVYYSRVYPLLRALLSRSLPSFRFFPRIIAFSECRASRPCGQEEGVLNDEGRLYTAREAAFVENGENYC